MVEYAIERCNLNNNYEIIRVASNARDVDGKCTEEKIS